MAKLVMSLPENIHPHTFIHYLKQTYDLPDVFYVDTWPVGDQICAVVNPELAQYVTVQHSLPKHPALERTLNHITGFKSLVGLEGQEHKRWRAVFNPGFSTAHLMTLVSGIVDDCTVFRDILVKHAEKGDRFLLEEAATGVTIDVIGRAVLRSDASMNAQTSENEFVEAFRSQLTWLPKSGDMNPFRIFNPVRPFIFLYNEYRMNRYLTKVVSNRLQTRHDLENGNEEKKKRGKPILDLALDEYRAEEGKGSTKNLDAGFLKGVMPHIKVFMFAGHDTTSSTICYAAKAISENPEVLQKFRAECDEVFGPNIEQTAQKIKDDPRIINRLTYTVAVIKETLRLFPAASSVRLGQPGYMLQHEGRQYPTDTFMTWPVAHALHHSPKFWPEAESFIPERWLVKEGDPLFPIKGAYRPFEWGPRNCIGQELAMIESRVALVLMLRDLTIEVAYDEGKDVKKSGGLPRTTPEGERAYQILIATAKPAEGMPVRMKRG
ncbi:uncharacterized protein KY384_003417 [Bacidia gigantensis]|uniref:uncharacterized protein n=1 Tax=Bacidia gigantensis TaxID=2732470 RepID=UPI001D043F5C|nr:uncharacterized protein KY384_003417 [Bacidia gigantensis]KAG8531781.1 hypothetical protein KY384_003417 [Bacidia gigantensis]